MQLHLCVDMVCVCTCLFALDCLTVYGYIWLGREENATSFRTCLQFKGRVRFCAKFFYYVNIHI